MGGEPRRSEEKNLFSLPENILGCLWSQWLSVHDFCRLDTAVCNSVYRPKLLGVFKAGWFYRDDLLIVETDVDIKKRLGSLRYLQWISKRELKFTGIALEQGFNIPDNHGIFILGYEICMSQGSMLTHLELLEVNTFRFRLPYGKKWYITNYSPTERHPGSFTDEMLVNISKSCTNITSLDIQAAPTTRLTYRSFCSLLENCPCITSLSFGHTISLDDALYAIRKHCNQELRMLVITFRSESCLRRIEDVDNEYYEQTTNTNDNDHATLPAMRTLQSLTLSNLRYEPDCLQDEMVYIIQKFSCLNLTHISFDNCGFHNDCRRVVEDISKICNNLQSVELEYCHFWGHHDFLDILILHNRRRLTEITITQCNESYQFIQPIIHCSLLRVLHLHEILDSIPNSFFSAIAEGCPLLTSVTLIRLKGLTRASLLPIFIMCRMLTKLSIDCCAFKFGDYIDDVVSYCGALEELYLPYDERMLGKHFILQLRQCMHLPLAEKSSCYAQVLGLSEEQLGLGPHRNFVFVDILEE